MKLTFLGTGTSHGVPVVGCTCTTCTSKDPRDRRTRHAALVESAGGTLLVDTPPELRLQLLSGGIADVDAVWFTHMHADHVAGIDDLRIFSTRGRGDVPAHLASEHLDDLTARYSYIFDPSVQPPEGTHKPAISLHPFEHRDTISLIGETFIPLAVPHGPSTTYGFRVGGLGYITDAKSLPADVVTSLQGVETLVLNAVWFGNPHPTHFNVEEAIEAARAVGAERTFLVHLTHRVSHDELLRRLPEGVAPAYDGLSIQIGAIA